MEVLRGGPFFITRVSLSGCGRWAGAVRHGRPGRGGCDLWDRSRGRVAFTAGVRRCEDAVVHPSGATLVGWHRHGPMLVTPTAAPRTDAGGPDLRVDAVAWSADGRRLVGAFGRPGWLVGWDAAAGVPELAWEGACGVPVGRWAWCELAVSPGGELLAVAAHPERGHYWLPARAELRFAAGGELVQAADLPHETRLVGLLDDGTLLAVGWERLGRFDLERNEWRAGCRLPPADFEGGLADFHGAAVSPDGDRVLAGWGGRLHLLAADTLAVLETYTFPTAGTPTCVAFAPDGLTAACGTSAGEVVVWDVD